MTITKEDFVKVLKILENDGCIDSFIFYKNENSCLKVCPTHGDDVIYHIDEDNNIISPSVYEIQKQIIKLEKEKIRLENQLKLLTND